MALPLIALLATLTLLAHLLYKHILQPLFLSPLSSIPPVHWSAPLSSLWILHHRYSQSDTFAIHAAHTRLGPIIRLAPNELSLNSVNGGIRTIYAGGFEKGEWYSEGFANFGVPPMFGMHGAREHGRRKRMVSHVYAKSTLQGSGALSGITKVLVRRLRERLDEAARKGEQVEMYELFAAAMMDFVTGYVFGLRQGTDFLREEARARECLKGFKERQRFTFWAQECAKLMRWVGWMGLRTWFVPKWVDESNADSEKWVLEMCDRAEEVVQRQEAGVEKTELEDTPTVYAQLREGFLKECRKDAKDNLSTASILQSSRLDLASELLDHVLAGFDTSSITLTYLAWQLSRPSNLHWQSRLRTEIATLNTSLDAKLIDNLPVLHAVLMETLRLHTAIHGIQPRVTPTGLTTLGDPESGLVVHNIPGGVRVQSQAYSLHRNPEVFPDPEEWRPERWLPASSSFEVTVEDEARLREQLRWFWAFSSGGRMCVGSHLAMLDMKATIVGVWGRFETEIGDEEGMREVNGGYMAEPLGVVDGEDGKRKRFLRLRLRKL
ncbi:cytochrome p450 monooxygenase like protein [Zymoseptoria brevis]|uniref:Cytochrome p450 monooxygenase like protein n=1 Tax=Zymoseptoria brevis TaxID=1047168 RepID=A0A0F4GWP8_9PEZI|nr:cytochrome p450 monooxygenase like protein [Zymoseptoria brevis]